MALSSGNMSVKEFARDPRASELLAKFDELVRAGAKVNTSKFHREFIAPEFPSFPLDSWKRFAARRKRYVVAADPEPLEKLPVARDGQLPVQAATKVLVGNAIRVAANALQEIENNPSALSAKERVALGFQAMRAQDSRVMALTQLRKDMREAAQFEKTFSRMSFMVGEMLELPPDDEEVQASGGSPAAAQ